MATFTTSDLKNQIMNMISENEQISPLLDNPAASLPAELLGTSIFSYLKNDFAGEHTKTYIGIKIDYPSVCTNKLYRNYDLTITVTSNNNHIITDSGHNRTDLIGDELIKMLNGIDGLGFPLEVTSDVEDPLNEQFYYRKLIFHSIISNHTKNGVNPS